jgi:PTS system nitrogen regulatory IIA component
MPYEDFDLDSLAKYLHITPQQVMKLADRGKLPGRKVAGQWVFSQHEIHHWLEDRIGASDEIELVEVEGVLDRAAPSDAEEISITEMLPLEAIAVPLEAKTRSRVISSICELAVQTGLLWDATKMEEAVRDREELHPTALDNGVALLHPRRPLPAILAEPFLALGRTYKGIPFGGGRGNLTDIFFLICSTDDRSHLRILARLSRVLTDTELLDSIRTAQDALTVRTAIESAEARLVA